MRVARRLRGSRWTLVVVFVEMAGCWPSFGALTTGEGAFVERDASDGDSPDGGDLDAGSLAEDARDEAADARMADAADAASPVDARSPDAGAMDSGLINVVPNPGFETNIVNSDCGSGWAADGPNSSFSTSSHSHSGSASCRMCNGDLSTSFTVNVAEGASSSTIYPGAWAELTDAGGTVTEQVGVTICDAQGKNCGVYFNGGHDLTTEWTVDNTSHADAGKVASGAIVQFTVQITGGCALVDDVSLYFE